MLREITLLSHKEAFAFNTEQGLGLENINLSPSTAPHPPPFVYKVMVMAC